MDLKIKCSLFYRRQTLFTLALFVQLVVFYGVFESMQSILELIAGKKGVEITHEAAVGKISEKEITYLMTRKLSREQAVSLIIRGFMDVGILGLPDALNKEIKGIVDSSANAE